MTPSQTFRARSNQSWPRRKVVVRACVVEVRAGEEVGGVGAGGAGGARGSAIDLYNSSNTKHHTQAHSMARARTHLAAVRAADGVRPVCIPCCCCLASAARMRVCEPPQTLPSQRGYLQHGHGTWPRRPPGRQGEHGQGLGAGTRRR